MSFSVPAGSSFQNHGYLYGMKTAGDGSIFYCPAIKSGPYSSDFYSPLITTADGGQGRSSYMYNPRMINWNPDMGDVDTHRVIVKSTEMGNHRKVFAHDVFQGVFAHAQDQGYNVVFSDGSALFCKGTLPLMQNLVQNTVRNDSDYASREQVYDIFEGM